MDYAATDPKYSSIVRKIPVKPGAGHAAYYQIKTTDGLHYLAVFSNGDLATKSASEKEWKQYKGPEELKKLYDHLRKHYELNVRNPSARFEVSDFEGIPSQVQSAAEKLKSK